MPRLKAGMCPSLNVQVISQLNAKGIFDVLDFISTDPEKITATCGLPFKKVLSIRRVLLAQYSSFPVNGLNLYDETLGTVAVLSTGCTSLDELLGLGIYTGEVTEIVGNSVSGKTQFCQTLSVNVAATLDQNIICIDTSGGWSVRKIASLLNKRFPNKCLTSTLSRMRLCQCVVISELLDILTQIRQSLQSLQHVFYSSLKLIIIDSVAAILSPCFFSGSYIEGLSMLQSIGRQLNALAKDFAVAIVITNNVVSSGVNSSLADDNYTTKPALGQCWTFVPSVRIIFRPLKEPCQTWEEDSLEERITPEQLINATLDKSPHTNSRSTLFRITQNGVESIK